jgi:hypothetical protein
VSGNIDQDALAIRNGEGIVEQFALSGEKAAINRSVRGEPPDIVGHQSLQKLDAVYPTYGQDAAIRQDGSFQGIGHGRLI